MTDKQTPRYNTTLGSLIIGAVIAVGAVHAETYSHGNDTTSIEQSGGGSTSQVEQYPGGQTVITQDGNNTDISIQRGSGASPVTGDDQFEARVPERMADDPGD